MKASPVTRKTRRDAVQEAYTSSLVAELLRAQQEDNKEDGPDKEPSSKTNADVVSR